MLVLIDNYDSFTYNLVQYFQILQQEVLVFTNDGISIKGMQDLAPQYLVLSPGPKGPQDAGICLKLIEHFHNHIPILGICLGHQCLAHYFGAAIVQATEIIHGKTSLITHQQQGLFNNIPSPFRATRYHSLIVDKPTLPPCFTIDAWTNNTIMAISHRQYPLYGLQFHPESILSEYGLQLLTNYLTYGHKSII